MAMQSSVLAWRIPWTEEPGGLQSMGSQRVGHNIETEYASMYARLKQLSIAQHSDFHLFSDLAYMSEYLPIRY